MMSYRLVFLESIVSRIFRGSCYAADSQTTGFVKSPSAYFEQAPKFPGTKLGRRSESRRKPFFSLKSLIVQTLDIMNHVGPLPLAQKATDSIHGRPGYK